jgi:hypothetical protein
MQTPITQFLGCQIPCSPCKREQIYQAGLIENQMPLLQFKFTKLSKIIRLLPSL